MALIKFDTMLEHLQSPHSLPSELLSGQEGLHYGDVRYMPLQRMLKMQRVPYNYFVNLVQENNFQPVGTTMDDTSNTTTILLVFTSDNQLQTIEYIHIGLVVCHVGCQLYEPRYVPCFTQSIDDDLKRTREQRAASGSSGKARSYSMFIANFGGLMAVPTDPSYCLMYPNIYSTTVPNEDGHHFNIQGGPPGLHTRTCIYRTLLQYAHLSETHRLKYHGSHLVIPWGAQYSHLLPEITMPCNHWVLLVDLHTGDPFPLVPVGDFQLEDTIFSRTPDDSLMYNSEDLTKLRRLRFQVTTHRMEQTSTIECKEEKSQSSCGPGEAPSLTSKNGEPKSRGKSPWAPLPKMTMDSPNRKSLHHQQVLPIF